VKVFISHSRDEEWLVKLIAAELEKLEVTPYQDRKSTRLNSSHP